MGGAINVRKLDAFVMVSGAMRTTAAKMERNIVRQNLLSFVSEKAGLSVAKRHLKNHLGRMVRASTRQPSHNALLSRVILVTGQARLQMVVWEE